MLMEPSRIPDWFCRATPCMERHSLAAVGPIPFGTAFAVSTTGSNFMTLHTFSHGQAAGAMILSSNTLYGTTVSVSVLAQHQWHGVYESVIFTWRFLCQSNFIGQHPVWAAMAAVQKWLHGVRRQHQWHGFYELA